MAANARVRFMVMVWLEGGQGEVKRACSPPRNTPNRPTWIPPPPPPRIAPLEPPPQPLLYPPLFALPEPPPQMPPPPPQRGPWPTISWGCSWRPELRGRPPRWGYQGKTAWDQNGVGTKTNANALANPSPFLSPVSHSMILTLCKRVAFCRSAAVLSASNPHPTLHSTLLPHSCN